MSFYSVAVLAVGEGIGATILGGAMLGGTMTIGANLISGQDPFDNIGKGILMGGLTAGLTPGVAEAFKSATDIALSPAMAAGLTAGGLNTLATGDLSQGIVAGLGAYGMAGLSANLGAPVTPGADPAAAVTTVSPTSTTTGYTGDPALGNYINSSATPISAITPTSTMASYTGDPALNGYINSSATPISAITPTSVGDYRGYGAQGYGTEGLTDYQNSLTSKPSFKDQLAAKFEPVTRDPKAFLKANASNLMYAAAPLLAGADLSEDGMPQTTTRPGMIRPYSFDPYSGQYTEQNPYQAAGGGLMGMDDGGYSPGQLNFVQQSEPVVRMASGGLASFAVGGGVSNEDIQAYMNANQGASDAMIAAKMVETGVSPERLSSVMGYNPVQIAQRYATAVGAPTNTNTLAGSGASNAEIQSYMNANQGASDAMIAAKMQETGVSPQQLASAMGYDPQVIAQKYAAAVGAPTNTAPAAGTAFFKPGDPNSPYYQGSLPPAATTAPAYTNYSTQDITNYLLANPNANIAEAIKQNNADPAAVNKAIGALAINKIGADFSDPTQTGRGTGTGQYVDIFNKYGIDANELFAANKATNPNYTFGGDITADALNRAFKTAKDFKDFDPAGLNQGLKDVEWVKKMDATKSNAADIARLTGLPIGEVKAREDAARALLARGMGVGDLKTVDIVPGMGGGVSGAGVTTVNPNGTVTTTPDIPNRPVGGFTGMTQVKDAYTKGGGSLGYTPYVPKTIEEFDNKYTSRLTGGSKQAYDYLMGKTAYNPKPYTATGELQRPYSEAALGIPANLSQKQYLFDPKTRTYKVNPDYVNTSRDSKGVVTFGLSNKEITDYVDTKPTEAEFLAWATTNNLSDAQIAMATGMPITEVRKKLNRPKDKAATTNPNNLDPATGEPYPPYTGAANGGLMAMARGGAAEQYSLGDYSDGGRLLRGPGDGVSDSIPATIGNKRPARLADGEFVVPARIVSELGNGSTEAGARKLYAMMDKVQAARRGTVGKGRVAKNSRSDKYLPA